MWIELLRRWLDGQKQVVARQKMEERRVQLESNELEQQGAAEFVPWHVPPFY